MKKQISFFSLMCAAMVYTGCGTFLFIGPDNIGLPETRPEGASEYCLFVSSQVLEESKGAIKGTEYAGVLAENTYNLYARNIFWVLDFSSDNFDDIKKRLITIGFDSPIIRKAEHLPYFAGNIDGTKACYVKKY